MTPTIAFVRSPGSTFNHAISSHPEKHTIDVELVCSQHEQYVSALIESGIEVIKFPPLENCPDATFVEDTTVVFDHVAVACPNKEKSRQEEGTSIHAEIKKYRPLKTLPQSITLDGGDVLNTEEKLFVGISSRTNRQAVDALAEFAKKPVVPVEVHSALHLKTAATYLGNNLLVLDSSSIDTTALTGFKWIDTGEADRYAANCISIGNTVLVARGFPRVADKIRAEGFNTVELDMSEFEKADGALTCLSIIFKKSAEVLDSSSTGTGDKH